MNGTFYTNIKIVYSKVKQKVQTEENYCEQILTDLKINVIKYQQAYMAYFAVKTTFQPLKG